MTPDKKFDAGTYLGKAQREEELYGENSRVELIPVDRIRANRYQPRVYFDEEKLRELSNNIKERGVLQPITVRKIDDPQKGAVLFEIATGERRFRAASMAGLQKIPAIIKSLSDADMEEHALVENIQREDLLFLETIRSYASLKERLGSAEEVSVKSGKDRKTIEKYVRIYKEISKMEDIKKILDDNIQHVNFTKADLISRAIPHLLRMKDKRPSEYKRVFDRIRRTLKTDVSWLNTRFERKQKDKSDSSAPEYFVENDGALILRITVRKDKPLTEDIRALIDDAVKQFNDRLIELPVMHKEEAPTC